jgi:hypothetical protein
MDGLLDRTFGERPRASRIVRVLRSNLATPKLKIARIMVILQLFALCAGGAMASSSEEVLESAVARIPEIARIIASLPVEDQPNAFDVAERCYLRTAKYLGGADDLAQRWASAIMYRLREQVEERVLAKSKLLTALYEELVGTPIAAGISESATGTTVDASAEITEKDIEQVFLKTNRSDIERDTLDNEAASNAEVDEESTNKSM